MPKVILSRVPGPMRNRYVKKPEDSLFYNRSQNPVIDSKSEISGQSARTGSRPRSQCGVPSYQKLRSSRGTKPAGFLR